MKTITYRGRTLTISEWAKELGIPDPTVLHGRLRKGWSVERTLETPWVPRLPRRVKCRPVAPVVTPKLPGGMTPEFAAFFGLITDEEYLACYREAPCHRV